ncbi:MAG: tripartite tricarboxylate transporter substrate binding protein, partial [Synergistaceae bacterium]|nr:tripartite tricarboxylate transporter substrate binding protein [Synergistaceae bacterium]
MKRLLACVMAAVLWAGSAYGAQGIIGWAEGGGTDTLMRLLASQMSGVTTVNKTGLAGAVATNFVYNLPADGETLLMNAENPTLYKLLGYGDVDYSGFECVLLAATEVVGVIVPANSKWQTFTEIVNAAKEGREIVEATTNIGGMPWTLTA